MLTLLIKYTILSCFIIIPFCNKDTEAKNVKNKELKELTATIKKITDGDTVETNEYGKIRFKCSDTPEFHYYGKHQNCEDGSNAGKMAKNYLETLLKEGDKIKLKCDGTKAQNRPVCYIFKGEVNINELLLVKGYAFGTKYCTTQEMELFYNARDLKKGLFESCNPEIPCKFRKTC